MAGQKQRRRKKHRGTQAGTLRRRRSRTSRPASRAEAREVSRQRREDRMNRPPTWRGAVNRAALAALVFFAVLVLLLRQDLVPSVSIAAFMFLVYIPLGHGMDALIYRVRQRRKERGESS